jgi:XTP/dITP diphosphohydrolase
MTDLLIATTNAHKVSETLVILGSRFRCLTLSDFPGAPAVIEDANTFAGNATKKSVELARWLQHERSTLDAPRSAATSLDFVLADDSGLEADALKGAPGVHSARFAALYTGQAGNSSSADNNAKLLRLLAGVPLPERTARFRCVLALTSLPDLQTELFDGVCEGRIGFDLRGQGGFGYDPLFTPEGYSQTFGELGEEIKNRLSHRARALEKLKHRFAAAS